jgi:CBS domain-containing protein
VPALRPGDRLLEVLDRLSGTSWHALPVTDEAGHLLGVVSLDGVLLAARLPHLPPLVVAADLMRTDVVPLRPDDRLDRALELFAESDLLALPVVEGSIEGRVLGLVKRADISSTYLRHVHGAAPPQDGVSPAVASTKRSS